MQKDQSTKNLEENLKDIILLDSNSNATIFCKKKLVDKAFNSKDSMIVETNGDSNLKSSKKHTMPLFKEKYWFNEDSISNIFSLANRADKSCYCRYCS